MRKNMAEVFGENRPVGFAREITKTFETIKKMTLKIWLVLLKMTITKKR